MLRASRVKRPPMEVLMGARSDGVRRASRDGKSRWVIDFRYFDKDRLEQRYRKDAQIQTGEAARREAQMRRQLALDTGNPEQRPSAPTFADFVETKFRPLHLAVKCRPSTRRRYEELLEQGILETFGEMRMDAAFATPVRAMVAELTARGIQTRSHVSFVRTVLRSAFDLGVLDALPELPKLPAKAGRKLPDAPNEQHVTTLLANAKGWLRTAIALAAYAGMRQGEVRALEVCDVDFDGNRILVRRAFSDDEVLTPKSTHERVVPLFPELRDILVEPTRRKLPHARVVFTERGSTPGRAHVLTALKRLEEKLVLREWSFHSLRHFFISALVRNGASIEVVRLLAGHSKLDVTQRYVHAEASELRAAVSRLKVTSG